MPEGHGTITQITPAEGKKPVKVRFSDSPTECATFEPPPALAINLTGTYTWEEKVTTSNGRTYNNRMLLSFTPDTAGQTVPPDPAGKLAAVSPEVWEAKDRRIAMESAYSSAARILQAIAAAKPDLVTGKLATQIARTIYLDVQAAGRGKNFSEPDE